MLSARVQSRFRCVDECDIELQCQCSREFGEGTKNGKDSIEEDQTIALCLFLFFIFWWNSVDSWRLTCLFLLLPVQTTTLFLVVYHQGLWPLHNNWTCPTCKNVLTIQIFGLSWEILQTTWFVQLFVETFCVLGNNTIFCNYKWR